MISDTHDTIVPEEPGSIEPGLTVAKLDGVSDSRHLLRDVGTAATATAAGAGASWAAYNVLVWQAQKARTVIPHRTDNAPNGDGVYFADGSGPHRAGRDRTYDLHLMVFGDSTAAGLGSDVADETPGVRVVRKVAAQTGRTIRYSNKAIVGATSKGLAAQIDATLIAGERPDVVVILVGANDVTARNGIRASANRLGAAVRRLREIDAGVVVGTCPDLGVISAIPQPLRAVLRLWGLRLAAR